MGHKLEMVAHVLSGGGNPTVNSEHVHPVSWNPEFKLGCSGELRLAAGDVAIVSVPRPS